MSKKNLIFIIIAGIILIQVLVYLRILPGRKPPQPESAEISFWGMRDDQEVWRDIILSFQKLYPHIEVAYTQLNEATYEETLINKIAEGKGPDVFMAKNTLLLKHRDKIYPVPQQALVFSSRDFSSTFVDGLAEELVTPEGQIIGFPLFVDTPVLFYNKDILNAAAIAEAPHTWEELVAVSRKLTQKNAVGEIIKSGLALGTFRNVDNAFEIISTLILQYGDPIIQRTTPPRAVLGQNASEALQFFTSFADPTNQNFSWTSRLPDSLTAFAESTSAFAFGFFDDISRIRAKNPHLDFGILPFPQRKASRTPVVYGRYFLPVVSQTSQNLLAAFQFVNYITRDEGAKKYIEKTNRPPARRDLLTIKTKLPELDTFYRQALIAKEWPSPDEESTKHLFEEAVDSVTTRALAPFQAIQNLKSRIELLIP